jgi:hypothetical protein
MQIMKLTEKELIITKSENPLIELRVIKVENGLVISVQEGKSWVTYSCNRLDIEAIKTWLGDL